MKRDQIYKTLGVAGLLIALNSTSILIAGSRVHNQTEAVGANNQCYGDCVVNHGLEDLGKYLHNMAYFSADPNSPEYVEGRELMDRNANPQLNAIGVIEVIGTSPVAHRGADSEHRAAYDANQAQAGFGHGWLINECLVITNHHVAFMGRNESDVNVSSIEFRAGLSTDPSRPFAFSSKGKVAALGSGGHDGTDGVSDWAVIKLDHPVADPNNPNDPRHQWRIPLVHEGLREMHMKRRKHFAVGYYSDLNGVAGGNSLYGVKQCRVAVEAHEGANKGTWSSNCPANPGDSGSPILYELTNDSGSRVLVSPGITTAVRSKNRYELSPSADGRNMNMVVPWVNSLSRERLQEIINHPDNKCSYPAMSI